MRILIVTNMYRSPERQAYGAFVWQQVEQLRQLGHTVDVVKTEPFGHDPLCQIRAPSAAQSPE